MEASGENRGGDKNMVSMGNNAGVGWGRGEWVVEEK